jgi:hypothetical protein
VIALNFDRKMILIGGTEYAGENKKSVFTLLNYLLPGKGHHADALLGQPRPGQPGGHGRVLRPVGHRQDDAVGRPGPHADRR